jgi:nucleotide-binding universal stress UspA family protein
MRNPLRSEAEAFRFLLLTIGYFALIVIGALIKDWVGVAVFVVLTLLALYLAFFRGRPDPLPRTAPSVPSPEGEVRILVIANETIGGKALTDVIDKKSQGVRANVLVVAPALVTPLQHLTSDEDPGRAAAQKRLDASVATLRARGVDASGEVGDSQPLQAIEDAMRTFGADEIIISTHPEGRSHWLEIGVVNGARERFAVPITHVVVDLDAPN